MLKGAISLDPDVTRGRNGVKITGSDLLITFQQDHGVGSTDHISIEMRTKTVMNYRQDREHLK